MNKMEQYQQFWLAPSNLSLVAEIQNLIQANKCDRLDKIINKTDDGKIDLRGVPLNYQIGKMLLDVNFNNIDFSYSNIDRMVLQNSTVEDCNFSRANIEKWWDKGCKITNTRLDHINFVDLMIGGDSSQYTNVSFVKSDLRGSYWSPQFVDCDFSDARLTGVDFNNATFTRCKFGGRLRSVWFNHYYRLTSEEARYGIVPKNYMKEVDFTETDLADIMFTGGIDLSQVILPIDGSMIMVKNLHTALNDLIGDLSSEQKVEDIEQIKLFCAIMLTKTKEQKMWIFSRNELVEDYGENDGTYLFNFLHEYSDTSGR